MKENRNALIKTRTKAVINIFLIYLFVSVVTGRYKIFAAMCASVPFMLPVIFGKDGQGISDKLIQSVMCGVIGVFVSMVFMILTDTYETTSWLVPSFYGLVMCAGFSFVQKRLTERKRAVLKGVMFVLICFFAFL